MVDKRIFEKYVNGKWLPSRLRFLRMDDIFRWRDADDIEWSFMVVTADPVKMEKTKAYEIEAVPYKLTKQFEFDESMTHVVVNPEKE